MFFVYLKKKVLEYFLYYEGSCGSYDKVKTISYRMFHYKILMGFMILNSTIIIEIAMTECARNAYPVFWV